MSLLRRTRTFLEMIKFSHSVFALPFALIAMLVAAGGVPGFGKLSWIVVAVVAARTAAMCFNRIADRDVDARNPRTRNRALVTGELSLNFAWGALFTSVIVFYLAAGMLNYTCLLLATPCLLVLLGYSLTKRVTHLSHGVLGIALGLAPVGAWIAVTGGLGLFPRLLLGAGVSLWVAGFDVLYSCQDHEVDVREEGLFSLPKRVGIPVALEWARRLHAGALGMFLLAWWAGTPPLGVPFLLAVAACGAVMVYEHSLVRPTDLSRVNAAFFTANGMISIGLLLVAWIDV